MTVHRTLHFWHLRCRGRLTFLPAALQHRNNGTLQRDGGCAYCPVIWRKHLHPEKGQACWMVSVVGPGPLDLNFSSYNPIHGLFTCHLVPPLQPLEIKSQGWALLWWTFSQYVCTPDHMVTFKTTHWDMSTMSQKSWKTIFLHWLWHLLWVINILSFISIRETGARWFEGLQVRLKFYILHDF